MNSSIKQKMLKFSKIQFPILVSFYVGWKASPYIFNYIENKIEPNPNKNLEIKLKEKPEEVKKEEKKIEEKKEEEKKEEEIPNDVMKMFSEQYIKKFITKINQSEKKINFKILTKDSKIEKTDFILAFVLSQQFDDNFIKKTCEFLEKIKKEENREINVYFKLITKLDDIKNLEKISKRKFLLEDGFFNFLSVFNSNIKELVGIKPSDILINNEKLVNKFKKFISINSKNEFYENLENLKTDELILFFNKDFENTNFEDKDKLFKNFIYDNNSLNLDSIKIFEISENCDIDFLKKNNLQAILNSKDENFDFQMNSKKFKIFNFGSDFKNTENLNNKISSELEKKTIFRNNFINGKRKKFSVDVIIDNNVLSKDYIEYVKKNIKLVKNELKENSNLFDFSLIKKNIPNSQKGKIIIRATDIESYKKKIDILTKNKDLENYKNYKIENPDLVSSFSTSFIYPYETYTKKDILNFCLDIINKNIKFGYYSQKEFPIEKYSKKIVGENFKENILDNKLSQVIFYYSKNCQSCKRFLPIYENIFKEYLSDLENKPFFNRIDNDTNHNEFKPYYSSTPKIVLYRKDFKEKAFVYNNQRFTKRLFEGFLSSSLNFSFIDFKGFFDYVKGKSFTQIQTEEILI